MKSIGKLSMKGELYESFAAYQYSNSRVVKES
ncbi:hypothetical protein LCGC14_0448750 [marine sediment metagenome]|uniref:Uncharacterized protein n=1 Tax=marine sediment metagenome TaxID=412755 RepID=A0A0F9SNY1_9ZZZZ